MTSQAIRIIYLPLLMAAVDFMKRRCKIDKIYILWQFVMKFSDNFRCPGKINYRFSKKIVNDQMDDTAPLKK